MTVYELIRQEVSAEAAARLYGLRFDRGGRGFCPWHDDGKHAALQFFDDRKCHCHSCHAGGGALEITMQMLGLNVKDAAERLRQDFHLDQPTSARPAPATIAKARRQRDERAALNRRWGFLCDVVREADERLMKFTPDTITPEFDRILAARCQADTELDLLWEEMKCNGRR